MDQTNLEALKEKFQALEEKMSDAKYANQAYTEDGKVVISGKLFEDILETFSSSRVFMSRVESTMTNMAVAVASFLDSTAPFAHTLMEQHIENIDLGVTYTVEQEVVEETEKPEENGSK